MVLWEGTVGCTIDKIIHSYVEAHNVVWKKDGGELREAITNNGFRAITFDTVKRTDVGLMMVAFDARSHKSARPRQFGFDLTVQVNCECI